MSWWLLMLACSRKDCGEDVACKVEDGKYLSALPEGGDGEALPVFVFFHGYNSNPERMLKRDDPTAFREAGWLTVFPEGLDNTWSNEGSPSDARDEIAFVEQVLDDVAARWNVNDVVVVSGFSQGSSMAWDTACYLPGRVTALAGGSGSFWSPEPTECEGTVPVRHTHGTQDSVMPLEGRAIGQWMQGDVREGIATWVATNGCNEESVVVQEDGPETCEVWLDCSSGDPVSLCLFDGGHSTPKGWAGRMLDWIGTLN